MESVAFPDSITKVLDPVVEAIEARGFPIILVGALAAWVWGHPRTTNDLDVVVMVGRGEENAVRDALLPLGWPVSPLERNDFGRRYLVAAPMPVEVFLAPAMPLQQREFARAVPLRLGPRDYRILSKEDFILRKLVNLKVRNDTNDALDLLAVMMRHRADLDEAYIRQHCAVQRVCGMYDGLVARAGAEMDRLTRDRRPPSS